jgi:hypothetical protein
MLTLTFYHPVVGIAPWSLAFQIHTFEQCIARLLWGDK